jgi:hypothetical protein
VPFYDQYGNELVSLGPPQLLYPDSGILIEPAGGRGRVLGSVVQRRRVEVINAYQVNDTAVSTGGTFTFGQPIAADWANELIVYVDRSGAPTTSPTGLQLEVQTCDCFGGASNGWVNLQTAIAITIPNNTFVGVMSLNVFTNFGALLRVGLTATAVGTGSGVENVILMLKG